LVVSSLLPVVDAGGGGRVLLQATSCLSTVVLGRGRFQTPRRDWHGLCGSWACGAAVCLSDRETDPRGLFWDASKPSL